MRTILRPRATPTPVHVSQMTWEEKLRQTEELSAQRAAQLRDMHDQMSDLERQLEASERARKQACCCGVYAIRGGGGCCGARP